ncbi:TIGR03086 family metal-binding protein [Actinacidiphila guanduensis]|uniref:TIGR03086 family protein n=1 Tax=Actinacidiphila guanduensis TaxID=310781 RepID=A0A1H0H0K9_9ACTN|nr:TIGR03086 family metal-binding protein [Actinacidiphila guanduensis]SDO12707.1 TIGR03086 family protein [Actinacidiphila guanduensis]
MTENVASPPAAGADTRPGLFKALALAGETIANVRPDQYGAASPCPEYDAEKLVRHLIAVVRRMTVAASGGNPFTVELFADEVPAADWGTAWKDGVRDAEAAWSKPGMLGTMCQLGFTTLPGVAAAVAYTTEVTIHTWDLAKATGQQPAWDPAVLAPSLGAMRFAVPATPRTAPVPFGPVVEVPADAPPIDQLVAWYGRRP